jgi:hypothetical protein
MNSWQNTTSTVLTAAAVASGAAVSWRAVAGPGLIHSPMNVEGAFGLAVIALVMLRAAGLENLPPRKLQGNETAAILGIGLLCAAAFARTAGSYFLSDDFVLLQNASDYRRDTWHMFIRGGGDGFFRPLIYMTIWWTKAAVGQNPWLWHAIAIAIHAANCALVYFLAAAVGYSRFTTALASILFAVHGTRPETVVWMSGRFDLLATFFALLTLVAFRLGWRWMALLAMIPALLCKESAYAIPFMLIVIAKRWRETIPFWMAAAVMFAYRWRLMQGIGGYITPGGKLEVLSIGLIPVLKGFALRIWATMFFPINWSTNPGWLLSAALIAFVVAVLWSTRSPMKAVAIPLALTVVAALPTFHRLLIGPDLENSRYLYLPSIGFCLLLASMANGKPAVAALMVIFSLAALEHNLTEWNTAAARADSTCGAATAAVRSPSERIAIVGLPGALHGVYFFQNGLPECVSLRSGIPSDHVTMLDRVPTGADFSTVLTWDPATFSLRRN